MKTFIKTISFLLVLIAFGLIYGESQTGQTDKSNCIVRLCVTSGPSADRQIVIMDSANCTGNVYTTCMTGDDGCCEISFPGSSATYSAVVISAECANPCTNFVPCLGEQVNLSGNCP